MKLSRKNLRIKKKSQGIPKTISFCAVVLMAVIPMKLNTQQRQTPSQFWSIWTKIMTKTSPTNYKKQLNGISSEERLAN